VRVIAIDQKQQRRQQGSAGRQDRDRWRSARSTRRKLTLGQTVGTLTLVLRAPTDKPNAAVTRPSAWRICATAAYVGGFRSRGPRYVAGPAFAGLPAYAPAPANPPVIRRPAPRPVPAANINVLPATAVVEVVRGLSGDQL